MTEETPLIYSISIYRFIEWIQDEHFFIKLIGQDERLQLYQSDTGNAGLLIINTERFIVKDIYERFVFQLTPKDFQKLKESDAEFGVELCKRAKYIYRFEDGPTTGWSHVHEIPFSYLPEVVIKQIKGGPAKS